MDKHSNISKEMDTHNGMYTHKKRKIYRQIWSKKESWRKGYADMNGY